MYKEGAVVLRAMFDAMRAEGFTRRESTELVKALLVKPVPVDYAATNAILQNMMESLGRVEE